MSYSRQITTHLRPQKGRGGVENRVSTPVKLQIDECFWAVDQPELQKACYLARVCATQPPKRCQYRDVVALLQVGPTCGLTAVSMLLGGTPPPQHLLATAKQLHYTNNGEMFSARNLFQLICDHFMPTTTAAVSLSGVADAENSRNAQECVMHEGRLDCAKVRDCLLAGDCIFVPYPFLNSEHYYDVENSI